MEIARTTEIKLSQATCNLTLWWERDTNMYTIEDIWDPTSIQDTRFDLDLDMRYMTRIYLWFGILNLISTRD